MNLLVVTPARMGSPRLQGKVLRPLAGAPLLQRFIERDYVSHIHPPSYPEGKWRGSVLFRAALQTARREGDRGLGQPCRRKNGRRS